MSHSYSVYAFAVVISLYTVVVAEVSLRTVMDETSVPVTTTSTLSENDRLESASGNLEIRSGITETHR